MRFVLELKDKRIAYVGEELKKSGNEVVDFVLQEKTLGKGEICVVSPAHKWTEQEIQTAKGADLCLGGKIDEEAKNKFNNYVNMLLDEDFAVKNAILTAEATLGEISKATEKSLYDMKILVLGSGRIAKALWKMFYGLGVKFDTAMRNEKERVLSQMVSQNSWRIENAPLTEFDLIINTIPAKLFDDSVVQSLRGDQYIIELASVPCIDANITHKTNFVPCGGLPGKILSKSAGKVVLQKLLEEIKKM